MSELDAARERLGAVATAVESLGPILELDRRWRSPRPGETVDDARALRTEIQEVLDRPRCAYDDAALELYRALPRGTAARALVGELERHVLIPYTIRSTWLAIEERSAERLRSGLVLHALALPDEDDYRDVMISLAPARVVADELGADAAAIFAEAAEFAGAGVADTIRSFGLRETGLSPFGWQRAQTEHGLRFHVF